MATTSLKPYKIQSSSIRKMHAERGHLIHQCQKWMHCKTYEASKFCVPAANVNVLLAWPAYQFCTVLKSVHWISVDPIDPLHPLRQAKLPSPNKVPWARALALQIEASLQASRWVNSTCTMRNGTFNYDQNAGQQTYPFTNYSSNSFKLSIYYITTQAHRVQKNTRASNTPCSTIKKETVHIVTIW